VRILFSSTWGYGHVFPQVPLARALVAAGHTVLWATNEQACARVAAAGLSVVPAGLGRQGVAQVEHRLRATTVGLRPQDRAAFAFPNMFGEWTTPAMVTDLLPLARRWRPDLMVHEQAELASPLVGAALGVPSITHAFGAAVPTAFLTEAGERVAWLWAEQGLQTPDFAGSFTSAYVDICPPSVQSGSLDHVGVRQPMRPVIYSGESPGALPTILQVDDPRRVVYVTLGTVQNHVPVLVAAVRALADLGTRILVTVGADADPAALGRQPDHVGVERWVSQSEVLPRCDVLVSHAGSGTFLGALSLGLPQLCLPQAADQFRNAAAVVSRGAGLALHPDEAAPTAINEAVSRLLSEGSFREAALCVAEEIDAMPAPADVVQVLEHLC